MFISDINIFDSKYYRNGLNINLNENQPSGQSSGDFWYQITTA